MLCNVEKKEPYKRLVGIKNSWKYEKDLIILNASYNHLTITHAVSFDNYI